MLIDFENVQPKTAGSVGGACQIKVFLGARQSKIPLATARALQAFARRLRSARRNTHLSVVRPQRQSGVAWCHSCHSCSLSQRGCCQSRAVVAMSETERSRPRTGSRGAVRDDASARSFRWTQVRLLAFAVISCAAGCATPVPFAGNRGMRVVTEASLNAARRLWDSSGVTDYQYSPKCNGMITAKALDGSYPLVVVKHGTEVKSHDFDGFLNLTSATTMDGIFDEMQRILAFPKYRSGTVDFAVQFHPTLGYPVRLYLGDTDVFDSFENCTITHVRRR